MQNKTASKEVLSAVQAIVSATKGRVLDESLFNELNAQITILESFFEVNSFQAVVLSLYLEFGFRKRDLDNARIVDHFGRELSSIADVYEAIVELSNKKLIIPDNDSFNFRKDVQNEMKIHNKAIQAMLLGDINILKRQVASSFLDLLSEVEDLIKQRTNRSIDTDTLIGEVNFLLESNKHFPEVAWLLAFEELSTYDRTLLLKVCVEQAEGEDSVDFDKNIKEVFDEVSSRIQYKKAIKEERCNLFKLNLIELSDSFLSQMNYVQLTPDAFETLLGGYTEKSQIVVKR